MKDLLKKILDQRSNGLYFVNTPTGSAKSYSAVQLMKNNYKTFNQHFIFITNNLNNLPMKDLEKALGDDYKSHVIRVESIIDNILHHFDETIIPDEYKKMDSYKNLKNCLKSYQYQSEYIQKHSDKAPLAADLFKVAQDKLLNADSAFRKDIRKKLLTPNFKKFSKDERKRIIKSKYSWLRDLYPAMFVEDYKIICMSVKRFFTSIDPIYVKKYRFSESNIIDNSILFIDEVDATKNEINNIIIESSLRSTVELIPMVHRMTDPFINWKDIAPKRLQDLVPEGDKQFDQIRKRALEIRLNCHDELPYFCSEIKSRNFLMSDSTFHANFEDKSRRNAYVYYDKNYNQMTIDIKNSRHDLPCKLNDAYSLFSVIRDMSGYLVSTKRYIIKLASDLKDKHNSEANEEDYITDEEAIHSIYNTFKLAKSDILYFDNDINIQPAIKVDKTDNRFKKTNGYYNRGIRSFEFTNSKDNSFNTSFSYINLYKSAEYVLMMLAKKATVIGLSATCNIDSVLSNYSLRYLKENLGDDFHVLEEEDRQRIAETYSLLNLKYDSGEIKVKIAEVINCTDTSAKDMIQLVFEDPKIQSKAAKVFIKEGIKDKYQIQRYLRMSQAYRYFILHTDIKSFLCLNNALPKDQGQFRKSVLDDLFGIVNKECSFNKNNVSVEVLKSGLSFDEDKKSILERLSKGEKIFVISAYATIGAGQNMAYELPDGLDTINLTDFANEEDGRNKKKDFDGIYLGDITNVVTNLLDTESGFEEENLLHFLIELENLYENNEITHHTLNKCIGAAYQKLKEPKLRGSTQELRGCRSIRLFKTKQIIQAIGRLSRSFNKNKMIYILVTRDIVDNFDTTILENEILSPETMKLAEYAKERQESVPTYDYVENEASRISSVGKFHIYEFLSGDWTEKQIELYKELGETCLQCPTSSNLDNDIVREYYIHSEAPLNKYYFMGMYDFEYTDVFFNQTKEEVISRIQNNKNKQDWLASNLHEVSEENARLSKMLNYPGLREEFIKHAYATSFEENDYILSPVLYQNIYKGRLGEFVGRFVIKKELGIDLEELSIEEFERFDFKRGKVYIDFKHWRYSSYGANTITNKILNKLDEVEGKKAIVINIFDENEMDKIIESNRIIEIPALLENDGFHANPEAINKIRMCLEDCKND